MKPTRLTVYLPVNVNEETFSVLDEGRLINKVVEVERIVFTPEQLNEYTQSVIRQAFEAGRRLTVDSFEEEDFQDYEDCISNLKL
jgi:hypothetical protein